MSAFRIVPQLEPNTIYAVYLDYAPTLFTLALYFTKSSLREHGFLCRSSAGPAAAPAVIRYDYAARQLDNTPDILALVKIGTVGNAGGDLNGIMADLAQLRLNQLLMVGADMQVKLLHWWRLAVAHLMSAGHLRCRNPWAVPDLGLEGVIVEMKDAAERFRMENYGRRVAEQVVGLYVSSSLH